MMKYVNTNEAPAAIGPYSQAIISNGTVYTSGQIPIDPITNGIEAACIEMQTEQVIKNLSAVLKASGSDLEKVIKTDKIERDGGHRPSSLYKYKSNLN